MQAYNDTILTAQGNGLVPYANATVTVYLASTTTLASLFSNNGTTVQVNPFQASSLGVVKFYAADGRYDIKITGTGFATVNLTDVLLEDFRTPAFNYNNTLSGTVSLAFSSPYYFNILDTQTNNYAGGENIGLFVGYQINGGKGAKTGISNITTFSAATTNLASFAYYQSAFFKMYVQASDGGTGLTLATSKGNMYGLAAGIFAQSGAVNLQGVTNELDVSMSTGSSAAIKSGLTIVGGGLGGTLDNVAGTLHDSLLSFTTDSAGNIGYLQGISIGRQDSYWPINSAGSILSISQPISGSPACTNGIDLTGCTFTGSAYKSNGFSVSNTGAVLAGSGSLQVQTVASAVNSLSISGSSAGNPLLLTPAGADANPNIRVLLKGTGNFLLDGGSTSFTQTLQILCTGANGSNIGLSGNGGTTPNKFIRASNGSFDVVNSAYSAVILSLSDTGRLTLPSGTGAFSLPSYTVGTLPTGVQGDTAYVTNALGPTYGVAVAAGGAIFTPVFKNATQWVCA